MRTGRGCAYLILDGALRLLAGATLDGEGLEVGLGRHVPGELRRRVRRRASQIGKAAAYALVVVRVGVGVGADAPDVPLGPRECRTGAGRGAWAYVKVVALRFVGRRQLREVA